MFRSYLTAAIRNFIRNRLHFAINVFGLSLGLAATLLALMFVADETSFDNFHGKGDRIYRLNKITTESTGSTFLNAESSGMMGPGLVDDFPEVEKVVRYQPWFNTTVLINKDKSIELAERAAVFVDSTFFKVFDFNLIKGEKEKVLERPSTIVLTPKIAAALFGEDDPVGQSIIGPNGLDFEVTGIAEPAPRNSHIQYDVLISYTTTTPQIGPMPLPWMNNWIAQSLTTYVLLKDGASAADLQAKLPKFMQDHLPTRVDAYSLYLQPFHELYLSGGDIKYHRMAKEGNKSYVVVFSMIAGFVLVLACVNYVNIQTSRSVRRAREVGMRKTLGANRRQLVTQFLGESLVVTFMSLLLGCVLVIVAVPYFNEVSGKALPINMIWSIDIIVAAVLLVLIVSVVSGIYPAFILAAFRPGDVLKLHATKRLAGNWSRDALITFQFAVSIVMIACTLLVYRQVTYMRDRDLGFNKDHVLVVTLSNEALAKATVFDQEVERHPQVISSSLCRSALGTGSSSTYLIPEGFPPDEVEARMFPVDGQYATTYGLKMASGRFFDLPAHATDSGALVINETLARRLKWEDPMSKTIRFSEGGPAYPIIGVLRDFNFKSLYSEVEPMVIYISNANAEYLSIRFTGDPSPLLSSLESTWKSFESRYPFKYFFVDEAFARSYEAETSLFKTIVAFSILSIVIACLGLYGLVSFIIEQRTREFGIRKVLGASVAGLNFLVNRQFVLLIALASALAVPAAIPLMERWLTKFAYRTEIGADVFVISIMATLAITVIAVSLQAIRAARMNPANTLRAE